MSCFIWRWDEKRWSALWRISRLQIIHWVMTCWCCTTCSSLDLLRPRSWSRRSLAQQSVVCLELVLPMWSFVWHPSMPFSVMLASLCRSHILVSWSCLCLQHNMRKHYLICTKLGVLVDFSWLHLISLLMWDNPAMSFMCFIVLCRMTDYDVCRWLVTWCLS